MTILVKIGSALISEGPRIRFPWLAQKVWEIAGLIEEGHQFLIVSSGAVAAGMELQGVTQRPSNVLDLQLLSGIGQVRLMKYYKDLFKERGVSVAQILLTHHNLNSARERDTITQIISAYLEAGVVPIVNENDMVDKEEFEYKKAFSDNDILAAIVAVNTGVDLAILLTDVDGLYASDPKVGEGAEFITHVPEVTAEIEKMATPGTNALGLGGMKSKVEAARQITGAGIPVIIASGHHHLKAVLENQVPATRFQSRT